MEVIEQFFVHLSGEELKTCKLVSRSWNEIIKNSKRCLNKLTIVINKSNVKLLESKGGDNSIPIRKCRNIRFDDASKHLDRIENCVRKHPLKYFGIKNTTFPTMLSLRRTLAICSSSVTELYFDGVNAKKNDESTSNIKFRSLKKLTIKDCNKSISLHMFRHSFRSLEELSVQLKYSEGSEPNSDIVELIDALLKMKRLQKLSLGYFDIFLAIPVLIESDSDFPFKLNTLEIYENCNRDLTLTMVKSFEIFLMKQKNLVTLVLRGGYFFTSFALTIPLKMKKLKHLSVIFFPISEPLDPDETFDCLNESIETLSFVYHVQPEYNELSKEQIKTFLKSMPNLT